MYTKVFRGGIIFFKICLTVMKKCAIREYTLQTLWWSMENLVFQIRSFPPYCPMGSPPTPVRPIPAPDYTRHFIKETRPENFVIIL